MSDPSEATRADHHPVSQHRTPREIAADEAGPIGKPDLDLEAKVAPDVGAERKPPVKIPPSAATSRKPRKRQ
jgi:hypothetical protein